MLTLSLRLDLITVFTGGNNKRLVARRREDPATMTIPGEMEMSHPPS